MCPEGILLVAEHAAKENKLFSLNLSAPFISLAFTERLDRVLPYVDLLFGNEQEAEAYSKAHDWGITDVIEIAKRLETIDKVGRVSLLGCQSNTTIQLGQHQTLESSRNHTRRRSCHRG